MEPYHHILVYARRQVVTVWLDSTHLMIAGGMDTHTVKREVQVFSEEEGFVPASALLEEDYEFCLVKVSDNKVFKLGGNR